MPPKKKRKTTPLDLISRLDDGILTEIFLLIGKGSYRMIAGTNKRFRKIYRRIDVSTSATQLVQTVEGAEFFCNEAKPGSTFIIYTDPFLECHLPCDTPMIFVGNAAARHGNLKMLKWAKGKGWEWGRVAFNLAASGGHLNVLEWLKEHRPCLWYYGTFSAAALHGQLETLKWLRANGCPWHEETCSEAASGGQLEALKWLRANGCFWDENTCSEAATFGQLEVLKWARANGCPWNVDTCIAAIREGQLDVLKWARANGCPWDSAAADLARLVGYHDIADSAESESLPEED